MVARFFKSAMILVAAAVLLTGCVQSVPVTREFERGTVTGNNYTTAFAQFTFTAPEGWVYQDDEYLANLMGTTADVLNESKIKLDKEIIKAQVIYDAMAIDPSTGSSVLFLYEKSPLNPLGSGIREDKYLEISMQNLQKAQLYDFEHGDIYDAKIGTVACKAIDMDAEDLDLKQTMLVKRVGGYILCITVTSIGGSLTPDILANFS